MNHRYNPDMHYRRSIRLRGYDYTHAGAYYVTIVAQDRVCLFGEVVGEKVRLGEAGVMVQAVWEALPHRFPSIETDAFVVMPNHIHGIIVIDGPVGASLVGALDDVGARVTMARDTRATTRSLSQKSQPLICAAPVGPESDICGDVVIETRRKCSIYRRHSDSVEPEI